MSTCSGCGHEVMPGDDFCTSCGTRQAASPQARPEPGPDPVAVTSLGGPPAPPDWAGSGGYAGGAGARSTPWQAAADETGPVSTADTLPGRTPPAAAFGGPPTPPTAGTSRPEPGHHGPPTGAGHIATGGPQDVNAANKLLGEAAPNAVYLGQRMLYEKQTLTLEDLDPVSNPSYRRAVLRHGLTVFLVWVLGQIVIVIVSAILSVLNGRFGTVIGALLAIGWWVVMGCVFWLSKVPAKLSEWKFLVDDKAAAAAVTFDHIAWAFSRRETPVDHCRVRRFKVMGQGSRDVLEVRQAVFSGLVSCFASGNDLYIGWSFWFSLSPARWLLILIRRSFWDLRFRGSAVYVSLQFDRARALREALHSAVREGVDVAAGQILAQGQGTIGSLVPVVADDSASDPSWQWLASTS
jgi:hypothetical protein